MRYAIIESGDRSEAAPGLYGTCPGCAERAIPHCGPVAPWHWQHYRGADCDSWTYEPMTEWHKQWQDYAPIERREVTIGKHRADIVAPDGCVVEVQHSPISADVVATREAHYGWMAWIFDARGKLRLNAPQMERSDVFINRAGIAGWRTFVWPGLPAYIASARAFKVYLDLGDGRLFLVERCYGGKFGSGFVVPASEVQAWIRGVDK